MHWMAWIGLCGTLLLATLGWFILIEAVKTRGWPFTLGRLNHARALNDPGGDGGYVMDVEFTYTVDGVQYVGDRLMTIGIGVPTVRWAERFLARIARDPIEQNSVCVWYNPSRPKESVLIAGVREAHIAFCGISNAFLVGTILAIRMFAF